MLGTERNVGATTTLPSPPFLPTSAINQPIPANPPISPDSAAMIQNNPNWVLPSTSAYREWLGPRQRTIYARITQSSTPTVQLYINYTDSGGYHCGTTPVTVPMPTNVQSVLKNQSGFVDNDRATWIVDENGDAWEGYHVTGPGLASQDISCDSSRWNAVRYDYWPTIEATGNGYGTHIGASASHMQLGAGLIRPDDMQLPAGSNLGHALRIDACLGADGTYAGHPKYVAPATSGDGVIGGAAGIPYGARIQLDPSIDVETWPSVNAKADPWREGLKKILRTLQVYGAIVVDHSCPAGSGGLESVNAASVAPYVMPWQQAGYGWGYDDGIPYDLMSRFRVIDWTKWTGMNATSSAPTDTSLPLVAGSTMVGSKLSATTGSWSGSPTSYTFQWQRCDTSGTGCSGITGATTANYTLQSGDQGATLRVSVTAANTSGSSTAMSTPTGIVAGTTTTTTTTAATSTTTPSTTTTTGTTTTTPPTTTTSTTGSTSSAPVVAAPTNTAVPSISGTAQQNQTLSAGAGAWSGAPTSFAYQWVRCDASGASCSAIGGATGTGYVVVQSDVGNTLRVTVVASNAGGSTSAVSVPSGVVAKPGNRSH